MESFREFCVVRCALWSAGMKSRIWMVGSRRRGRGGRGWWGVNGSRQWRAEMVTAEHPSEDILTSTLASGDLSSPKNIDISFTVNRKFIVIYFKNNLYGLHLSEALHKDNNTTAHLINIMTVKNVKYLTKTSVSAQENSVFLPICFRTWNLCLLSHLITCRNIQQCPMIPHTRTCARTHTHAAVR